MRFVSRVSRFWLWGAASAKEISGREGCFLGPLRIGLNERSASCSRNCSTWNNCADGYMCMFALQIIVGIGVGAGSR